MGSRKSKTNVVSNSNQNLDALTRQNESMMAMFNQQAALQRELFAQQANQLNSLNAGLISGQKTVLNEQQQAARNQELQNRAANGQSAADTLDRQIASGEQQRLKDKQTTTAQNQATRNSNISAMEQNNFISDFIRRQRMFA